MPFGFCRFHVYGEHLSSVLFDPVMRAPPKNGKPLLLSYLVDGVKDRALPVIPVEGVKQRAQAVLLSSFIAFMHKGGLDAGKTWNRKGQNNLSIVVAIKTDILAPMLSRTFSRRACCRSEWDDSAKISGVPRTYSIPDYF